MLGGAGELARRPAGREKRAVEGALGICLPPLAETNPSASGDSKTWPGFARHEAEDDRAGG